MGVQKVIEINPDFFTVSNKSKTVKKKKNVVAPKQSTLKNNIKKKLIKNIRNINKAVKEKPAKEEKPKITRLNEALSFLDNYLKEKKSSSPPKKEEVNEEPKKEEPSLILEPIRKPFNSLLEPKKDDFIPSKQKPDPPYGCLKGGKKITYSQYKRSLKRTHPQTKQELYSPHKIKIQNHIFHKPEGRATLLERMRKERQEKTKNIVRQNHSISLKHVKVPRIKKFRVKTIRRTYHLGKKNNKVSVLIKNNKTIKQIKKEIQILHHIPLDTMKKHLREKNLIRFGSNAPPSLIKEIYKNSILSGDVKNKNSNYLIHNYLYQTE